ncbi:DUF58 domain-containing protein [uncultured Paraglaciecola sp.]|uniref:DUF58 domain-containing protein n=1 Tax=uncultured Paraglaciecola sp. TaxID=1765024 RepID=UPI00260210F5|nr:DUF58 domain-containing protein [uncultured Paraglaciecola sp.]
MLQSYWNKWLNKRIPAATQHQLDHHNIFIFPAKFGLLFLALCILLFLLGTNYQNNLMLLLCYFLLALFLVNLLASYINFARVNLQIGKCPEVFVGDNLHIPLWLNANNSGSASVNGLMHFTLQDKSVKSNKKSPPPSTEVDANALTNPITISHTCQQRGKLQLSRVTVESFYPLGLYRCWTHLAFTHQICVFPKPIPCDIQLYVSEHNSTKKSGEMATSQSGHDDFSHLKAYQVGEPLNHVAWKHLAKGRGMVSKQFSSEGNHIGWLKLSPEYRHKTSQQLVLAEYLEKELGQLCYQVIELSRTQRTFGLDLGEHCIAPNSGAGHRQACLQALAYFPDGPR